MQYEYSYAYKRGPELSDKEIQQQAEAIAEREIQRGDWVYCCTIPGTAKVIDFSWPWYLPGQRLFLVEFQGREYLLNENEVEK